MTIVTRTIIILAASVGEVLGRGSMRSAHSMPLDLQGTYKTGMTLRIC